MPLFEEKTEMKVRTWIIALGMAALIEGAFPAHSVAQSSNDFRNAIRKTENSFLWVASEPGTDVAAEASRLAKRASNVVIWNTDGAPMPNPSLNSFTMLRGKNTIAFAVDSDLVLAHRIRGEDVTLKDDHGNEWQGKVVARDHASALAAIRVAEADLVPLEKLPVPPEPGLPVIIVWQDDQQNPRYDAAMIASKPASLSWQIGVSQSVSGPTSPLQAGSPVLDTDGNLAGVIVTQGPRIQSLSIRQVDRLVEEAGKDEPQDLHRGRIGIVLKDSDDGTVIGEVLPETPGQEANLQKGDIVISVNGDDCETAADVMAAVAMARAGDQVAVKVRRGDDAIETNVTLDRLASGLPHPTAISAIQSAEMVRNIFKLEDGKLVPVTPPQAPTASPGPGVTPPNANPVVIGNLQVERTELVKALQELEAQKKAQDEIIRQLHNQIQVLKHQSEKAREQAQKQSMRRVEEMLEELKRKLNEHEEE